MAVAVHMIPAAKVCRAGGQQCVEASSEIILRFRGKTPKNKQKKPPQKTPTKTPKTTKNQTEQLPKDNQRSIGTKRQEFTTLTAFRVPLIVLGFDSAFACQGLFTFNGILRRSLGLQVRARKEMRPWFVFA